MTLSKRLDWDSSFFGLSVGELASDLTPAQLPQAVAEVDARGFDCVYLLAGADADELLDAAQALGFRVRDARLTLERPVEARAPGGADLRRAEVADLEALSGIARERFRATRFFADRGFSRERCAELYVAWLRRGIEGAPARVTLVPPQRGGFVVCHLAPDESRGTIELIGVDATAEGRGLGSVLMAGALDLFADAGMREARVITQARNIGAQRLYQRHGFRSSQCSFWLHRWRVDAATSSLRW